MAEGLVSSTPEAEEKSAAAEAFPVPSDSIAPVAAAVAVKLADSDPEVAKRTAEFLTDQSQLLRVQKHHLEEQHSLHMAHLRNQLEEENVRRFGLRLRIGFQLFIVLGATVIGVGILGMIVSAMRSQDTVIDTFQVSPMLAERGQTGEVVARQFMDHLSDIQRLALEVNTRPVNSFSSNFGRELRLEVPETGISFTELQRFLREKLGHETHVSGEVYQAADGLTLTVRAGEEAARSFSGQGIELGALTKQAAEAIFQQTQPFIYNGYLTRVGRFEESRAMMPDLLYGEDPADRAWVKVPIASDALLYERNLAAAAELMQSALAEIPELVRPKVFLAAVMAYMGHDVESLESAGKCVKELEQDPSSVAVQWREALVMHCRYLEAMALGDYPGAMLSASNPAVRRRQGTLPAGWPVGAWLATHDFNAVRNFDWAAAAAAVAPITGEAPQRLVVSRRLFAEAMVALELGDAKSLELFAEAAANEDHPGTAASRDYMLRNSGSWLAYAKARFGDLVGGQQLIEQTPQDCVICLRLRGRVAALAGNVTDSEKWFAQAMALAPKLPQAYVDRGQVRLDRGDLPGATADAALATQLSPRNGDAWKLWGDVLAKQGQAKDALAKYDEAIKYAPKWQVLKTARAAVLSAKG